MASARLMISTDPHGNSGFGTKFDDSTNINNGETLTRIVLFYGDCIDSITMHYTGNSTPITRGDSDGTRAEIVIGPGEFITSVKGYFLGTTLSQLQFTNDKGIIFGPYGGKKEDNVIDRFDWKAPRDLAERMGLYSFSGRASDYIYQLRATFALYPLVVKPFTVVKFEKSVSAEPPPHGGHLSSFARNMMSPFVALHVGPDAVVFHAYEATLCRVPFFHAALQGQFREATEKKILIPEEKPEIISALIEYVSTGNYTYTHDVDATAPTPDLAQGCFHVRVYAVALMYDWPPLVSDAMDNFLSVLQQLDGMDVVSLWKVAYENGLTLPLSAKAGRLASLEKVLPKLLKRLYDTDSEEMDNMVVEFPALASDLMRFLVARCDD